MGFFETLKAYFGVRADKEADIKKAIGYKEATDAPDLSAAGEQRCTNCKAYQYLSMNAWSMPSGLCSKYDFISVDGGWCSGWEKIPVPETILVEIQAKESSLTVHKQADGKWRWLIVSSSSFMDKDKEIISQKALEDDTAQMNESKEFGTLDWWHTPIELGACDFSAMHGRTRIESGIFHDEFIAEKMAAHGNELAASLSFQHSVTEPDASGVYSKIKTFARALLPRGKESNLLTQVDITKESEMDEQKKQALVDLLGGDTAAKDKVDGVLAQAENKEQSALQAGIKHKEETPAPATAPEDKGWFLADMKPEEFAALQEKAMGKSQADTLSKMKDMLEEMQGMMSEMMKESAKEVNAKLDGKLTEIAQKQSELGTRLAALEGLTPRGYRPTQDPNTETDKETQVPVDDPRASYFAAFVQNIAGGQQPQGPKI